MLKDSLNFKSTKIKQKLLNSKIELVFLCDDVQKLWTLFTN